MTLTFVAYFRERLRVRLFGPVVLMLTCGACWAANIQHPWTCVRAAGLMTLLVVQFRLWDDLADRARDRLTYPGRVLVCTDPLPFIVLASAFAILALMVAWWSGGRIPLLALAGLNAAFAILYAFVRPNLSETAWQFPVLLMKYPAFVAIVAASIGVPSVGRIVVAALVAYSAANAYEAFHFRRTGVPPLNPDALACHGPLK